MEAINPRLSLLLRVKAGLLQGDSARKGVDDFILSYRGPFYRDVVRWRGLVGIYQWEESSSLFKNAHPLTSHLMFLLTQGFRGEPIYEALLRLEQEMIRQDQMEMDRFLKKLPYYMMLPLFFLQLPALALLLFGPLLNNFFHSFGSR